MFPQNSSLSLSLRDTPPETQKALNQLLTSDTPQNARVVRASADSNNSGATRIVLEINGKTIQLITKQPLQTGTQLQVSLSADGKLLLQQSSALSSNTVKNSPTSPSNPPSPLPLVINLKAGASLSSSINKGTTIEGTVIRNTPTHSAPPTTQASQATNITSGSSTYTRPISSAHMPATSTNLTIAGRVSNATSAQSNQTALKTSPTNTSSAPPSSTTLANTPNPSLTGSGSTATTGTTGTPPTTPAPPPASAIIPTNTQTQTAPQTQHHQGNNSSATGTNPPLSNTAPTSTNTTTPASGRSVTAPSTSAASYNIDIRLNTGQTITFKSPTAVSPNTILSIQRTTGGDFFATPLTQTGQAAETQREQNTIQDALRTALPNQQPLANSLSQLQNTASQSPQTEMSGLVRSMLQLFGVRPGTPEVPQKIRQNVQSGGTQTEAQLASGKVPNKTDMKGLLRQLQQQSADLPVEQRQRMEQLIQTIQSRITHNQLSSLQQWKEAPDGSFERVIQLDIPIMNNNRMDNLELRISQEQTSKESHELSTLWRARLHFDLEEYGAVDAEIKLTEEDQVQIQFWCNERHTHQHIQKQLHEFGQQLQGKGFETPELQCYHGDSPDRQGELIQKNLVDIHT